MAEQLPVDVWALILRHVPRADRFSSCALVSRKLRNAAAAATDALELAFTQGQEQRAEAFQGYLHQHGRHLTSLQLQHGVHQPLTELPCARLLCLELSGGAVQLGPHGGLPGVLANCTGLTRLDLSRFQVPTGLSGLSVLVDLRDLRLVDLWLLQGLARLPGSVFTCMQHLTRLQLSGVDADNVHHVSCLSSLAVLSIRCEAPSRLRLAPDIAPGFVLPASLHDLSLRSSGVELDPAVLSAVVHLTRLELSWLNVVGQGDTSSGAALLAAVSGLHKLVTLKLAGLSEVWPEPCAAYQALTASSRLQKLAVQDGLPAGAWECVFPPAAVCGELQRLKIWEWMSVEEVSALVRCCPRLQDLDLGVDDASAAAALKPLTCLTFLELYADGVNEAFAAECVQGVAALTSLRSLTLFFKDDEGAERLIPHAALLPLTALTALTRFHEECCYWVLANQASPGQPPDVWQQLQQYCLADAA